MRLITLVFLCLVILIQYPLWFGRGGWLKVHEMGLQLQAEQQTNAELRARNDKLAAEVKDLREGAGAVEERARYELGMIKEGEIFVQILDPSQPAPAAASLQAGPGADRPEPPDAASAQGHPAAAPATTSGSLAKPAAPAPLPR